MADITIKVEVSNGTRGSRQDWKLSTPDTNLVYLDTDLIGMDIAHILEEVIANYCEGGDPTTEVTE